MRRPEEVRAGPRDWIRVLKVAYPFLRDRGVGNLILYGSQALSFYTKNPLRSKDIDLVTDQIGPRLLEELASKLAKIPECETRSTTVQTRLLDGRKMRDYSVEMRLRKRPFFVEIFDAILNGQSPSVLLPHVELRKRWGLEAWVPSCNAVVALRLCFRQPEGISRLNAIRLNRFIRENRKKVSTREVARLIVEWGMIDLVRQNISQLNSRYRQRILGQDMILRAISQVKKHH